MFFEFITYPGLNFLTSFADTLGVPEAGDMLAIPAWLGEDSIRKIEVGPDFKLLVHPYTLREEFGLKRRAPADFHDIISSIFHCDEELVSLSTGREQIQLAGNTASAIRIASSDLDFVIRFPAHTAIYFTVIGIISATLKARLVIEKTNRVGKPFLAILRDFCSTSAWVLIYTKRSGN